MFKLTLSTQAKLLTAWLVVMGAVSGQTSDISITTNPPGAIVTLDGEARLSGVSPTRFRQPIMGSYTLTARLPGYEKASQRVVVDPTVPIEFSLRLKAKTRFKAAARSMIIPGWGQLYGERPGRAITFAGLSLASAVAFLILDHKFDKKYDEYLDVKARYDGAASTVERRALWATLNRAQQEAYDAEDVRRVSIGVAAGLWTINVLDALFLAPHRSSRIAVKAGISGESTAAPDPGLRLGIKF